MEIVAGHPALVLRRAVYAGNEVAGVEAALAMPRDESPRNDVASLIGSLWLAVYEAQTLWADEHTADELAVMASVQADAWALLVRMVGEVEARGRRGDAA